MSDGEDAFSTTVKLTRGTSTDDRDTLKTTITAPDVETLKHRVEAVKEHMESWADDLRDVQPETSRRTGENQSELGKVKP
ncbi:DUF7389 domain-containing protein [Halobacterium sp. KA-6]|uniref:DUF7389 domain-containing protein n=1 Tax=Halobacterium sp. KA-6 TaxID=2896368 RepID=UPI001E2EA12C|nr:hypothetical protein [Halobacterium sp. KA-6]MCD2202726.1 hypothetical protein [Halobacterium sp. KA-6]